MPEEPEVENEKLQEAVHEAVESENHRLIKAIALTTAVFAALASLTALLAKDHQSCCRGRPVTS
jgi:hypothetical protein